MKKVNVHEAKTHLSDLLQRVEQGEEFILCRSGEPIADLIPHRKGTRIKVDPFLSRVVVNGDLTKPIAEGLWEAGA